MGVHEACTWRVQTQHRISQGSFLAINLPSYMYEHGAHPDAAAIGMTTQISLAFHESMTEHDLVASLGVGLGCCQLGRDLDLDGNKVDLRVGR